MKIAAIATRRKIDSSWISFGIGDELGNRIGWQRWIYHQDIGFPADAGDRHDVAGEIEIQLVEQRPLIACVVATWSNV